MFLNATLLVGKNFNKLEKIKEVLETRYKST